MYVQKLSCADGHFLPSQTLECGQTFRYSRLDEEDYLVDAGAHRCRVRLESGGVALESDDPGYFVRYFDFQTDYGEIYDRLSDFTELREAASFGRGIRILRQEFFETAVSFIVSANNNIPRIQGILRRLCEAAGTQRDGYMGFPTAERLLGLSEAELRTLGCGFRAPYLRAAADALQDGRLYRELRSLPTPEVMRRLALIKGVGPKVAACIALFGLYRTDVYPVDTWIFRANRSAELDTPQRVAAHFTDRYGPLAGYAQQLQFYYAREEGRNKKRHTTTEANGV